MTCLRKEDGWAVATAMILMALMATIGLASMAAVDMTGKRTMEQRQRESALNLAEGVLYSQGFVLATAWPTGTPSNPAYPAYCSSEATTTDQCPDRDTLSAADSTTPAIAQFVSTDFLADGEWITAVRDDYGPLKDAYDVTYENAPLTGPAGTCPAPCSVDFDRDREMWVRARTMVRGRPRNIVAKLKLEELSESTPNTSIAAGAIDVGNSGNHGGTKMIDGTDSSITVRCQPEPAGTSGASCFEYQNGQVTPTPTYQDSGPLMDEEQLHRFRKSALMGGDKAYYADCSQMPDFPVASLVFVEKCTTSPNFQGSSSLPNCSPPPAASTGLNATDCVNQLKTPGLLIVACGGLQFNGKFTYVGVMYFANRDHYQRDAKGDLVRDASGNPIRTGQCYQRGNASAPYCSDGGMDEGVTGNDVFYSRGGFGVWGSVVADGPACVKIGSNGGQIVYEQSAFASFKTYGATGLVQNTWRELAPS